MLDLVNKSQEAVVDVSKQILKQNSFAMKLEGENHWKIDVSFTQNV